MAYKNPLQIERMIKAMDHPDFYFYIHLDQKIPFESFAFLANLPRVSFINKRSICNWGGFSFVRAVINSLKEVLSGNVDYDFYNLLSGQDYPIKPMEEIAGFFEKNKSSSYISFDEEHQKDWWAHAVSRFESYHFTDKNFKGRYLVQRALNFILPKRRFPLSLKLYGSSISSWWTITKPCAEYLVNFASKEVALMKFMDYTWGADEFFYATVLMNSPYKDQIVNDNLRLITWKSGYSNPVILTNQQFDIISQSEKLFARKFDTLIDNGIIDTIDKVILQ